MARIQFDLPAQFLFSTDIPIYISHVNQGGHLDNAQLLTLVSEARLRFFRWLGYVGELDIEGLTIVVGDMMAQYKSEAFYGETMQVDMVPADFNRYGFDLVFRLQDKQTGREVARGKTGVVFVGDGPDGGKKVTPVPAAFMARLEARQRATH
ncbi:thioesterase [Aquabacterium fontiphilum]|jgi:acyl-CoA thioesterase FadM|uniref:acyl-CoA thioesterase n=1 Tax=Aquabacterium fontiphilum TaxID=450365 RepID=UPI001377F13E|nr:thioesterase family protein [Aquabacterium fontiphilum]NBD21837.1 thioesterase [Aquabacterium fontiphilum]